jgi:hypothetical protein
MREAKSLLPENLLEVGLLMSSAAASSSSRVMGFFLANSSRLSGIAATVTLRSAVNVRSLYLAKKLFWRIALYVSIFFYEIFSDSIE